MPNVPPSTEDHLSEHLPWEHLTIPPAPDRRFLIYGVAAGLVIAVLGFVVVRQLQRPSPDELTPVAQVTAAPVAAPIPETPVPQDTVTAPTVTLALAEPEAPQELSEADLMAVGSGSTQRELAAHAEWLVLEFFTLDPSDPWRDRVQTASGLMLPADLAPDSSGGTAESYVEWTQTLSVEQIGEATFRATVLTRRLVAPDGADFRRLPAERVTVILRMEPGGRIRVASLPTVTTPPVGDLLPLTHEELRWTFDEAGIAWPSSHPHVSTGPPHAPGP